MPIDDPIDAIMALDASEERQRSQVSGLAVEFLRLVTLFAPKGVEVPLGALAGAIDWLSGQRAERREELVNTVVGELKYRGAQIDSLVGSSAAHRQFMADEMPGLVLDVLRRAEQTRAKDRIGRLGRILVHAAEVCARSNADYAEEMMRVAMDLGERDLAVLIQLHEAQRDLTSTGVVNREMANEAWRDRPPRVPDMGENEIQSICATLQSFGLVVRIERNNAKLGPTEIPYALLQKGKDFLDYIRESTDTEQRG